ncbi:proline dehydrogenase family protein [uncultured Methanofollis sp.]|uniref:proline dehydrogenase family protein n=1 Tax=uncultured Methanofollis sp. TaxID=262500 RepID=UPI00260905A8|nr:proline dehydrogenase family protein [uncultured Methanofollis sp.]
MAGHGRRWSLPDLEAAVRWCEERNRQGITCSISPPGEYVQDRDAAWEAASGCRAAVRAVEAHALDASVALKLSALGAVFDRDGCTAHLGRIMDEAKRRGVRVEIDMEGRNLVDFTLAATGRMAGEGHRLTLAVQAYLQRTADDLRAMEAAGIRPRLVKGAYLGDTRNFGLIQRQFHDPDLVAWLTAHAESRNLVEFGFLMGLADLTKRAMADEGWKVLEYVPYGRRRSIYEARRAQYLNRLRDLGRSPLP